MVFAVRCRLVVLLAWQSAAALGVEKGGAVSRTRLRRSWRAPPRAALGPAPGPSARGPLAVTGGDEASESQKLVARCLGYLIGAGSVLLYAPIIYEVVSRGRADGLSLSTFALSLTGYAGTACYNYKKRFPISTYVESIALVAQSLVLCVLVGVLQGVAPATVAAAAATFGACVAAVAALDTPPAFLAALQCSATAVAIVSLLPQILMNFRNASAGQWSVITAGLSVCGNGIRAFTTLTLTKDRLLLFGFLLGLVVNSTLLGQVLVYPASS